MPGPREDGPVAVVTAIPEEFEAVVRCASDVRFERGGQARARIASAEVVIARTGDGPRNAERSALALCAELRPRALVGAGVAGGLTPGIAALEVVASTRIIENGSEAPRPDASLVRRAERAGAIPAALVTVAGPVVTADARRMLASALGGETGAVDMESAGWARAAAAHGVPYVVLRAISDAEGEELPAFLSDCVGEDGGIRRSAAALRAVIRPSSWPTLIRMRRRVAEGGTAVAAAVRRLLAEPL